MILSNVRFHCNRSGRVAIATLLVSALLAQAQPVHSQDYAIGAAVRDSASFTGEGHGALSWGSDVMVEVVLQGEMSSGCYLAITISGEASDSENVWFDVYCDIGVLAIAVPEDVDVDRENIELQYLDPRSNTWMTMIEDVEEVQVPEWLSAFGAVAKVALGLWEWPFAVLFGVIDVAEALRESLGDSAPVLQGPVNDAFDDHNTYDFITIPWETPAFRSDLGGWRESLTQYLARRTWTDHSQHLQQVELSLRFLVPLTSAVGPMTPENIRIYGAHRENAYIESGSCYYGSGDLSSCIHTAWREWELTPALRYVVGGPERSNQEQVQDSDEFSGVAKGDFLGEMPIRTLGFGEDISSIAFSPDGAMLAVAGLNGRVHLIRTEAWVTERTIEGHTCAIWDTAFGSDNATLATGAADGKIKIWDVASGDLLQEIRSADVSSISVSSQSGILSSASYTEPAALWDMRTGDRIGTLGGSATSISFSPDGSQVLTGSFDVEVWDAVTGNRILATQQDRHFYCEAAFSPRGNLIASYGYGEPVELWDARTGEHSLTVRPDGTLISLAFDPTRSQLVLGLRKAVLELRDSGSGRILGSYGCATSPECLAFSPDGAILVSAGRSLVQIWDTATMYSKRVLGGHTGSVESIAFSQDTTQLVSSSYDGTVRLWDTATGHPLKTLFGSGTPMTVATFCGEHNALAYSTEDNNILGVLEIDSGNVLWRVEHSEASAWHRIAVSPSGDLVAYAVWGGAVMLRETMSGEVAGILPCDSDRTVTALAFSPTEDLLGVGLDVGLIQIWNLAEGQVQSTLWHVPGNVTALAFNPRGGILALQNYEVHLWDDLTSNCVRTLFGDGYDGPGPLCLSVSPDGTQIATGHWDSQIHLSDWDTGVLLRSTTNADCDEFGDWFHDVLSISFSTDGEVVAYGSEDGSIGLLRMDETWP